MNDVTQVPNQNQKSTAQKIVEGFGLEFPKDTDRFAKIITRFSEGGLNDWQVN